MKYRIRRVLYNDGTKTPWWKIVIYKNNIPFDESPQYSCLLRVIGKYIILSIL